MQTPRFFPIAVFLSTLSLTAVLANGCAKPSDPPASGAGGEGAAGSGGSGGGGGSDILPGASLVITPADVTIDVDNGDVAGKSVSFKVEAKQADGTYISVNNCQWTLENVDVGSLNGSTFAPSGKAGGATTVTCAVGTDTAVASVRVNLRDVDNTAGLDQASLDGLLGTMAGDPSVSKLLYPYDGTVFPRALQAAPELMWDAPSASDVYAAIYEETFATYTAVFSAPSPGRFKPPLAKWEKLLASNPGKQVKLTLFRLAGGKGGAPYRGPTQTWTLSTASLKGTVYFWRVLDPNNGDVVKMPFDNPPAQFLQSNGQCTGCHAVSHNGAVVAAAVSASGFAGSFNASTGQSYFSNQIQSGYRAASPDGSLIAWVPTYGANNYLGEPVEIADAITGAAIKPSGLEAFGLTSTPEFSADSKMLAFSIRNPPYDGSQHNIFRDADLGLSDFDPVTRKASNLRVLVQAQNQEALVFPTFTPDGKRVVFQRGNQVRARSVDISSYGAPFAWTTQPSLAELWAVGTDGKGLIKLTAANEGGAAAADAKHSFHPIMSPVVQGGYFWVVFTSMRTYGNRLTATADHDYSFCVNSNFNGCRNRQLWVAALDPNAPPGSDPSHPAFWLPGQDALSQNFDAYWALDPCKKMGDSCDLGFECCDGACHEENGVKTCSMSSGCAQIGDLCSADADCCNGNPCIGGVCDVDVAK